MSALPETPLAQREPSVGNSAAVLLSHFLGRHYFLPGEPSGVTTAYYDDLWQQRWFPQGEDRESNDQYLKDNWKDVLDFILSDQELVKRRVMLWASGKLQDPNKLEDKHRLSTQAETNDKSVTWAQGLPGAHARLASVILLDQVTRMIYRGAEHGWDGEKHALTVMREALEADVSQLLKPVAQALLLMPLLYAERLDLQVESVRRYERLYSEAASRRSLLMTVLERFKKKAHMHQATVKMFGRFPEFNETLGRASTEEEKAFLRA